MTNVFNTSKFKVMQIVKSQKKYPYYMNNDNQQLEEVTQEKDPGIMS